MATDDLARQVIAGLAVLTANLGEGRDYIDIFIPLVGQCILQTKPEIVSVTELQRDMKSNFGMNIPQDALKVILNRCDKKGLLKRREKVYIPNYAQIDALNYHGRFEDIIGQQDRAISKLINFAKITRGIEMTEGEAEKALLAYVQKHDIDLLECFLTGQEIAVIKPSLDRKLEYIVSAFIADCYTNDPEGFGYVDTIVKGHLLSHTLFFPDLGQVSRKFHRTEVFFDSPLMLRILGYEGAGRRVSCKEMLELLQHHGAALRCFAHTRDEVYGVLYGCLMRMQTGDTEYSTPAYNYFRSSGFGVGEIELEMATLDSNIANNNIVVVDKPEYDRRFQIDEGKLDSLLKEKAVYWREKEKQRKHDVDCLSAVYRLRKGRQSRFPEESGALFVTPNIGLCSVASGFFAGDGYCDAASVPVAIPDYALTTLLWLKTPMAAPSLPTKILIAECYAAIQPNERLWIKYMETAARLRESGQISSEQYYLLRHYQLSHQELMQLSMGDENAISEGSVREILEAVILNIRKDDLAELEKERVRHQIEQKDISNLVRAEQSSREKTEMQLELERAANREKTQELERQLQAERASKKETLDLLSERIKMASRRIAKVLSLVLLILIMAVIFGGSLYGIVSWWGKICTYFILGAYIVLLGLSIYNLLFGVNVKDLVSRVETSLAGHLQNALRKWLLKNTIP